jgi:glycosyltransferase involved in cell wall biosynthesis
MDYPDVSVVIPAHNAEAFLGDELAALATQEFDGRWEVIVVDNESTDGTARVARQWSTLLPELRIVPCPGIGVNRARNVGVRAARAPKVLMCDADDIVGPGWLHLLSEALNSSDVVGGALVTGDMNADIVGADPVGTTRTMRKALRHLPYAFGGNMGFRREVFDGIEGFDESFARGGDEIDFCWRAQYNGCSISCVPEAVLYRRLRRGLRSFARQVYGQTLGSARLYSTHMELGQLPRQRLPEQLRVLALHLVRLRRVDLLLHGHTRREYVRRLAMLAGAFQGFVRFRVAA